jgi:uncharacterized repeat protein (TIGR02543 family)
MWSNEYNVKYYLDSDYKEGEEYEKTTVKAGTAFTAATSENPTKDDYIFKGWTLESPTTITYDSVTQKYTMPAEDVVFIASFEEIVTDTYTITYGGGFDTAHKDDVSGTYEDTVTYIVGGANPSYTVLGNTWFNRVGYSADGWTVSTPKTTPISILKLAARAKAKALNVSAYSIGDVIKANDEIELDSSLYLTVNWSENSYKVVYDKNTTDTVTNLPSTESGLTVGNGGFVLNSSGDDYIHTLSADVPSRDNYEFIGWSTKKNAETASETVALSDFDDSNSVTVYAVWKSNTYKVTYDGNGAKSGSVPKDGRFYNSGDSVVVLGIGNLANGEYTFKEWNTSKDGKGTAYKANDTFEMPEKDVTLYAIWTDSEGNIVSPGTGESSIGMFVAFSFMLVSIVMAFGAAVYSFRRRRAA